MIGARDLARPKRPPRTPARSPYAVRALERNPAGSQLPKTKATVWNLHSDRWRGLTWHDEDDDVVWLLGVGWHESGSSDDAYVVLKGRDVDGTLFPTATDFEDAEPGDIDWFLTALATEAPNLMQRAKAAPNSEVREVIAEAVTAAVFVELVVIDDDEAGETWLSVQQPPEVPAGRVLPADWIMYVVAAVFQDVPLGELRWGGDFPRKGGAGPNEIVVH
jgi:hypothetical protein